ncbi:MAG: hypothetical protein ABGX22_24985 [Pirellulaceae bacterium]
MTPHAEDEHGKSRISTAMPDDEDFLPTNRRDLTRIDSVCDRFEAALREQREPAIEDYLEEVPSPFQKALLEELLSIEVAFRKED